uniref:Phage tail fibre protein N-terminal domain-containing protein n=1 Tax=Shewanella sp. (strain MR-7) TaxID=60481 RepID=Q0HYR5_SHESR
MASVITIAGEQLFAAKAQANEQLDIDTFIFANVPNQDPSAPINREEGIPTAHIVYQQNVQQVGRVNDNVVVYSTVLDSITGPFEFNWVGLYSSVNQKLVAINHVPTVTKTVTAPGEAGNTLNRNFGIEYSGIAALTNITVDAETWQLNFTARLSGMDKLTQQLAADMNGKDWFIDDGLKVVPRATANTFSVTPGVGYVSGLRVELKQEHILIVQSYPQFVYVDAWFSGNANSTWSPQLAFTVTNTEMDDYIDPSGTQHYVYKLAVINAADDVGDLRIEGVQANKEWVKNLSPSTFSTDWTFDSAQEMKAFNKLSSGEKCRTFGYKNINDGGGSIYVIVNDELESDDGNIILLNNGLFAVRINKDFVKSSEYGASEIDSTSEINGALNGSRFLTIDVDVSCKNVAPKKGSVIDISKSILLPVNSDNGDAVISNEGQDKLLISGNGLISGNKHQQAGENQHKLIHLSTNDSKVHGIELGWNYSKESPTESINCVSMEGDRNIMSALRLSSWSQEGLVLKNSKYCTVNNIVANDEDSDSWSAVQIHGSHNLIDSIITKNTGASSVGCDSQHSIVNNIISDTIRYHNGVNFGHENKTADYSVASNIIITNLNDEVNPNAAGLSVSNGTKYISVNNFSMKNPTQNKANKGINISNGGANNQLSNTVIDGAVTGVNLYSCEYTSVCNMMLMNCDYGINKNDDSILQMINVDLSGSLVQLTGAGATQKTRAVNAIFDRNDSFSGGISLTSISFPYRVSTKNMREFSTLVIEPSNANGAKALVYVSVRANGYFEINVAGTVDSGAHIRWRIV